MIATLTVFICFSHSDPRYNAVIRSFQLAISFGYCAYPFHSEILQREQERAQIASADFHIVRGERKAQGFSFVGAFQ